ncbi:hypothetical protein NL676_006153 [Syzygium grande]|nr:hypothetical protein NL676_006153 [Syzygium grande]
MSLWRKKLVLQSNLAGVSNGHMQNPIKPLPTTAFPSSSPPEIPRLQRRRRRRRSQARDIHGEPIDRWERDSSSGGAAEVRSRRSFEARKKEEFVRRFFSRN